MRPLLPQSAGIGWVWSVLLRLGAGLGARGWSGRFRGWIHSKGLHICPADALHPPREQITGQHREEYLARFAAHDAVLTLNDLAAACRLVLEMRAAQGSDFGIYTRWIIGRGPGAYGLLVLSRQTNYFDALGRLTQARREQESPTDRRARGHTWFQREHCKMMGSSVRTMK